MKEKLLNDIDKIKKVIKLIKSKQLSATELNNVLVFASQMVDDFLFKSNNLVNRLNKNLQKNNRVIDIEIKADLELLPTKETHEFLYLLKTMFAIMLSKKMFFNFYIFSEIQMILNYYTAASIKDKSYDSLNKRFKINEIEYHNQVIMYKYIYSIFDKLTYISAFIVDKYKMKKIDLNTSMIFTKDFDSTAQPLFKSSLKKENTKIYLKMLNQSSSFHFARKLRNNLEHSFTDPSSEYNIALETELLFVLVMRTLIQINNDFKTDEDLFKLININ